LRRLPVALLTGLLVVAAFATTAASASANAQRDAIERLNQIRRAHGLAGLRPSPSLHRSSTRYARHMMSRGYFGHGARIAVGSRFGRAGETLELHSGWDPQPERTISNWMNSPGHRAVLLSARFRWVGMGVARGRNSSGPVTFWVAHVGAR
jgi:uncharacterized protein YkwD